VENRAVKSANASPNFSGHVESPGDVILNEVKNLVLHVPSDAYKKTNIRVKDRLLPSLLSLRMTGMESCLLLLVV